uniref:uncharacterized protein LOC120340373 n=1 Tax=Styela clava TaxID=7725 RepID=UPI00193A973F|nr:uncharacterized protein LOC120340373 [Styela clava]
MKKFFYIVFFVALLIAIGLSSGGEIIDVGHPKFSLRLAQTATTALADRKVSRPPKQFRPQRDGRPGNLDSSDDERKPETIGQNDATGWGAGKITGVVIGCAVFFSGVLIYIARRFGCCTCDDSCNYCC